MNCLLSCGRRRIPAAWTCKVSAPIGEFALDCLNVDMVITSFDEFMIDSWLARISKDSVIRLRFSRAASF